MVDPVDGAGGAIVSVDCIGVGAVESLQAEVATASNRTVDQRGRMISSVARRNLCGQLGRNDEMTRAAIYSCLSAISGSTRAAFSAGALQAASAVVARAPTTATNVAGSVGFISYSRPVITRVNASAPATPSTRPTIAIDIPCRTTIITTALRSAPSAIRTPISCVRCATAYAITA